MEVQSYQVIAELERAQGSHCYKDYQIGCDISYGGRHCETTQGT